MTDLLAYLHALQQDGTLVFLLLMIGFVLLAMLGGLLGSLAMRGQ